MPPCSTKSKVWQAKAIRMRPSLWMGRLYLLLDLLQQPVGVIAGDERNVFVGAQLSQQRHELFWIGKIATRQIRFHLVHELWRVQGLHFARELDIKNQDCLI